MSRALPDGRASDTSYQRNNILISASEGRRDAHHRQAEFSGGSCAREASASASRIHIESRLTRMI